MKLQCRDASLESKESDTLSACKVSDSLLACKEGDSLSAHNAQHIGCITLTAAYHNNTSESRSSLSFIHF